MSEARTLLGVYEYNALGGTPVLARDLAMGVQPGRRCMQHEGMGTPPNDPSGSERVRNYRNRMRAQGMRPIQLWVADVRAPGFAAEARRQAAFVAASDRAADDQAFIDALIPDDR